MTEDIRKYWKPKTISTSSSGMTDAEKRQTRQNKKNGSWGVKLGKHAGKGRFTGHQGLLTTVISLKDAADAVLMQEELKRLVLLEDRVDFLYRMQKEVKLEKLSREAYAVGARGYIRELALVSERVTTDNARGRRTR